MLEVRNISKRFGDVVALDDVSLSVGEGELLGFLGPNGAGKTTTMRAVMGLIAVDGGTIKWNGTAVTAESRRRFGYMPAERGMYPKMTVRDQLVYFARLSGASSSDAGAAAQRWMDRMDIGHRAGDEVQALSSGNQQRVQLAIALVHEPELLILDEPFSGLDPVAVETMKAVLVEQLDHGTAVLFSSHQLDLVSDVSRDVAIVDGGRIVLSGAVRELREHAAVRYASVTFDEPVRWRSNGASHRTVRVQVPAGTAPASVLADAERAGTVVEFSFAPPDLSEVFFNAVGRPVEAPAAGIDEQIGAAR